MSWLGLIGFILSFSSQAEISVEPAGCLAKFTPPCAVLTHDKSELLFPGVRVFTSRDSLIEFRSANEAFVARGLVWFHAELPVKVFTKFGSFAGTGDFWVEMSEDVIVLKSLKGTAQVTPRGSATSIELPVGHEMELRGVDPRRGVAGSTWPVTLKLAQHLSVIAKVFPYELMNFQEHSLYLGRVTAQAAEANGRWYQAAVERKIANHTEREHRLKYEAKRATIRDSYLRRLFRQKSNFEEP